MLKKIVHSQQKKYEIKQINHKTIDYINLYINKNNKKRWMYFKLKGKNQVVPENDVHAQKTKQVTSFQSNSQG